MLYVKLAAGAVLFVASVTGGFFYGGLGFGRSSSGRLIGGGLGSSSGSISQRHGPVLVYSSDKEQQPGIVASIRSVLMHASGPVEFLYIGDTPLPGMDDMPQVRSASCPRSSSATNSKSLRTLHTLDPARTPS